MKGSGQQNSRFENVKFEIVRRSSEDEKKVVGHSSPEFKKKVHATDIHLRVKSKYMRLDEG